MRDKVDDLGVAKKYISLEKSAKDRGIEFKLSFMKLKKLLNTRRCFFTNVILEPAGTNPRSLTLDRVDASKGYTDDNVVACCQEFNSKKSNLTALDIIMLYQGFQKNLNK